MSQSRDTRLRFEQWAKNPECRANAISAVHNVPMSKVVEREGAKPTFGQSPFAIARGLTFERSLFKDDAAALHEELVRVRALPSSRGGFRDFRLRMNSGPEHDLDSALASTVRFLQDAARSKRPEDLPSILAGAVVRVPGGLMLPEAILVIDVLLVTVVGGRVVLVVGEVKTYPYRGGYTDASELATARAQAGVYVHGLRCIIEELGLQDELSVADHGCLVLTRPGSNRPVALVGEELRFQAERAKRGFELLRGIAREFGGSTAPAVVIPRILESETSYREACLSFCDRAPVCHAAALKARHAAILGDDMTRFLGTVPLERALELLAGAPARDEVEKDLVARIQAIDTEGMR